MRNRLSDGERVCIVGGGPAGSFAAMHLLREARTRSLDLEVLIFEPRDFSRPGPVGCNRCAGILSDSLLNGLAELELELPRDVIQADIDSYRIHIDGVQIKIDKPGESRHLVSVYRGGGPRMISNEVEGFDAFLLSQARQAGATIVPRRVHTISPGDRPMLHTIESEIPADLVILATGVNSRSPLDRAFGYRPPQNATMAQDEFMRPEAWPEKTVHAYFNQPAGLIFGALIPKGRYVNVSLLGEDMSISAVGEFLEAHQLSERLGSDYRSLCGCTPKIAVRASRRYYGPRWVAVGDAAVTRLYKDGIGSAFATARAAVRSALEHGVSAQSFRQGYRPYCREVIVDNRYGRVLFSSWQRALQYPTFRRTLLRILRAEEHEPPEKRIYSRILWGMLSGGETYRDLFRLSLNPRAMRTIVKGWLSAQRELR
ncbi:MAG: NAD(P)/FAD-dependent oxidoreductase [Anaerolineales bacterium]|nr:NAD(P)/FAD-dependent oxidoreductase [Anaerolineales bacterium]